MSTHSTTKAQSFQSTHSRGVRLDQDAAFAHLKAFQSTHSRGVRQKVLDIKRDPPNFNPRTHEECDVKVF